MKMNKNRENLKKSWTNKIRENRESHEYEQNLKSNENE